PPPRPLRPTHLVRARPARPPHRPRVARVFIRPLHADRPRRAPVAKRPAPRPLPRRLPGTDDPPPAFRRNPPRLPLQRDQTDRPDQTNGRPPRHSPRRPDSPLASRLRHPAPVGLPPAADVDRARRRPRN